MPNGAYTASARSAPGSGALRGRRRRPCATTSTRRRPSASVEVPLRVVMVGFEERQRDEGRERSFRARSPTTSGSARCTPTAAASAAATTRSLGRQRHARQPRPRLLRRGRAVPAADRVPVAARAALRAERVRRGLFQAMMASVDDRRLRQPRAAGLPRRVQRHRGARRYRVAASGDPAQAVAPGAPVRFVDGEATEDWIAANAEQHLGFPAGRDPGQPGYTVFVLNTLGLARGRRRSSRPASTTSSASTAPTPTAATSTASTGPASGAAATAS